MKLKTVIMKNCQMYGIQVSNITEFAADSIPQQIRHACAAIPANYPNQCGGIVYLPQDTYVHEEVSQMYGVQTTNYPYYMCPYCRRIYAPDIDV